jgi:hypothetical protein
MHASCSVAYTADNVNGQTDSRPVDRWAAVVRYRILASVATESGEVGGNTPRPQPTNLRKYSSLPVSSIFIFSFPKVVAPQLCPDADEKINTHDAKPDDAAARAARGCWSQ